MVGEAALVQRRLLLANLRLGPLALGLLLGDAGALLGDLSPPLAVGRLLAVLGHDPIATLVQFALAASDLRALPHARQHQQQGDHDDHNDRDDHDDGSSGHPLPPLSGFVPPFTTRPAAGKPERVTARTGGDRPARDRTPAPGR